ncbi:class I SAM-dependent methyltransferase [Myxosarcina sp. GI1(2024)]
MDFINVRELIQRYVERALIIFDKNRTESATKKETNMDFIDVKKLIQKYDVKEHAKLADRYFQGFEPTSPQLYKPFMGTDAIQLIPKLGVVLSNLDFFPEMRVLDFGGGTGWLAQSLAMMGCEVICSDVSAKALALGQQHTQAKYPEIYDRISYQQFDGFNIEFEDEFFDRIVCFDSFHHIPNQEQVLREFARVLKRDGIAVFCEPGPQHSLTPASQMEMKNFNVIENDIHIEEIWDIAKKVGFKDIKLSVFTLKPTLCSLSEFQSLRSHQTASDLLHHMYKTSFKPIWSDTRLFVLYKEPKIHDSRWTDGLSAKITASIFDEGSSYLISGRVVNTGWAQWRSSGSETGAVNVGISLMMLNGTYNQDFKRISFLDRPAPQGYEGTFSTRLPKDRVEDAEIYLDLVAEQVTWFDPICNTKLRLK